MTLLERYREAQANSLKAIVAMPSTLPSRSDVVWRVMAIQSLGGLIFVGYLLLLSVAADLGLRGLPWPVMGAAVAALLLATFVRSLQITAAHARLEQALAAGVPVRDLDAADVAETLQQYRRLTNTSAVLWALTVGVFALGAHFGGHWSGELLLHLFVLGVMVTAMTPTIVRYYFMVLRGFDLAGYLLPDGQFDRLGEVTLYRVYQHLWTVMVLLGVLMPGSLVLLARSPYGSPEILSLVAFDYFVVAGFVSSMVMRAISLPLGYLEGRMKEVGDGRLDVQARIFALDTFGNLNAHFNRMIDGLRQRERIRDIFGRYVTRQVAEEILSGRLELGGERRTATVLFADIRGFTHLSERMEPEEVVALLNRTLGAMVTCVLDEGGVLDKFIGDAVMALFGVPVSAGDVAADAEAAMRCALKMSAALDALNAERVAAGLDTVEMGIGLHTGELVAGNIGIPERMEYTVIGDTVNLCSRLEGLTRTLHVRIALSEHTAELVGHRFALRKVDTVSVRGREAPVTVYTTAA